MGDLDGFHKFDASLSDAIMLIPAISTHRGGTVLDNDAFVKYVLWAKDRFADFVVFRVAETFWFNEDDYRRWYSNNLLGSERDDLIVEFYGRYYDERVASLSEQAGSLVSFLYVTSTGVSSTYRLRDEGGYLSWDYAEQSAEREYYKNRLLSDEAYSAALAAQDEAVRQTEADFSGAAAEIRDIVLHLYSIKHRGLNGSLTNKGRTVLKFLEEHSNEYPCCDRLLLTKQGLSIFYDARAADFKLFTSLLNSAFSCT